MTCQEAIDVMGEAVEGQLPADLHAAFEEHMAECPPCATYLQHLHVTRRALLHLPPEGAASPGRDQLIEEFKRELGRG